MKKLVSLMNDIKYDFKKNKALLAMVLIPFIMLLLFQIAPLYGVITAFKDYHPLQSIWDAEWVGGKYFKEFFTYPALGTLVKNTLLINSYNILLSPLPIFFAICIHYSPLKRLKNILLNISIVPNFFSLVVVANLVMRVLTTDGILNDILGVFGVEVTNFLTIPELFPHYYVWSGAIVNMGYSSIIYINHLDSVPKALHEAAVLDGASLIKRIFYIDIPNIRHMYIVNLIFQFASITSLNVEKVILLQNTVNLPYSQVLSSYEYSIMFDSIVPKYSLAMAVGLVTSVVSLVLFVLAKRLTRRMEVTDE